VRVRVRVSERVRERERERERVLERRNAHDSPTADPKYSMPAYV